MSSNAATGLEFRPLRLATTNTTAPSGAISARDASRALGLSERTIRRAIARGELVAIKQGRAFRITPEALALYRAGRDRSDESQPATPLVPTALPRHVPRRLDVFPTPLSSFIGRTREVAAVAALLRQEANRLVILTGPGGVGKTRLALRVMEELREDFVDGMVFIPLASVRNPAHVLPTVARALEIRESPHRPLSAHLAAALRDRRLLLVLDNIEHLADAANTLGELLATCPQVTMLVTSRAPLRLSGERRFPTPPLTLPKIGEEPAIDRLLNNEAMALFIDRAQHVRPDFSLDADNATTVLEICHRLDGLPLAIELAAARLNVLSPSALLARLEHRLPLLTGGAPDLPARLRTMRDAISWSHDLLSDEDRRLFRRLAVFDGGFTLEAVEEVETALRFPSALQRGDSPSVLDLLNGLIDKSLVQQLGPDPMEQRFTMLETVREFALERLSASGDDDATRAAHAAHYLALAEAAASDAGGAGDGGWMRRLKVERPNLWTALAWLEQTGRADAVLQMSGALWHYWYRLGDLAEGRAQLERALAAAPGDVDPVLRARALRGAGVLAWQSADYDVSHERLEAALIAYRAVGDLTGIAWVLNSLGCLWATLSSTARAETYLTESLAIFHELNDAVGVANLTSNLGELAEAEGRHELAIARLEAGLAMWRALGDRVGAVRTLVFLGQALLTQGDAARAEAVLVEAMAAIGDIDYKQILPAALRVFAQLAARRGDDATAARWYGAADGVTDALGMELTAARRASHERHVAIVRETLGETAFTTAWAAGRRVSAAQAIAEVLAQPRTSAGNRSMPSASALSPRERQVLRLLTAGRSDKQIADVLFITRRTASKHVAAILAKLQVESRTAAAAFAARHGLA